MHGRHNVKRHREAHERRIESRTERAGCSQLARGKDNQGGRTDGPMMDGPDGRTDGRTGGRTGAWRTREVGRTDGRDGSDGRTDGLD